MKMQDLMMQLSQQRTVVYRCASLFCSARLVFALKLFSAIFITAIFSTTVLQPVGCSGEEKKPVNLLQLPGARLSTTAIVENARHTLTRLADGDAATSAVLPGSAEPVDIQVDFGDKIVSPAEMAVSLPVLQDAKAPAQIEVLGSMLPGQAGLRSLKDVRLKAKPAVQRFKLPASGVRYLLIRITPPAGAKEFSVGDIAMLGHVGPPPTSYAFKESPAAAIKVLARLKQSVSLSQDEKDLFDDAKDGRLDTFTLAEAGLIASGAGDAAQRKQHLQKFQQLTQQAKQVTAGGGDFDKGERLLRWLHQKTFAGGYDLPQSRIDQVLNTGRYNCVSSSLIYAVLGRRMGLDVRAVEVPDHVLALLYDGVKHVDVETTSPHGFDPGNRIAARRQFEKQTGFEYVAERYKDQRREIAPIGLVAVVYYNRGVAAGEDGKYEEALGFYFRALMLDREFASAVKNALGSFHNWSRELWEEKDFARAVEVVAAGLELAPDHAGLLTNRTAFYTAWAVSEMEAGRDRQAIEVLRQAHQADPEGKFLAMQSWIYIRPSEDAAQKGEWAKALLLTETGLKSVDKQAVEDLQNWRKNLYTRWSAEAIKKEDYPAAAKVSEYALAKMPDDSRFKQRLAFIAQEWARTTMEKKGLKAAIGVLQPLITAHPDFQRLRKVADSFVRRTVIANVDNGEYSQAVESAARGAGLMQEAENAVSLRNYAFDRWAKSFVDKQQYKNAATVYEDAVQRFPDDKHLQEASVAIWIQWARTHAEKKQWSKALAVYQQGLKAHPADAGFRNNVAFYGLSWAREVREQQDEAAGANILSSLQQVYPKNPELKKVATIYAEEEVRKHYKAKKYAQALDAALSAAEFHPDKAAILILTRVIADNRAGELSKKGDHAAASATYEKALSAYPGDKHLTHNLTVIWQLWGKSLIDASKWKEGAEFYAKAVKRFPGDDHFKKALAYCRAKAAE